MEFFQKPICWTQSSCGKVSRTVPMFPVWTPDHSHQHHLGPIIPAPSICSHSSGPLINVSYFLKTLSDAVVGLLVTDSPQFAAPASSI